MYELYPIYSSKCSHSFKTNFVKLYHKLKFNPTFPYVSLSSNCI